MARYSDDIGLEIPLMVGRQINCQNLHAMYKQLLFLHNSGPLCKHGLCAQILTLQKTKNLLLHKGHYSRGSISLQCWSALKEVMQVYKTNYLLANCNSSNPDVPHDIPAHDHAP